MESKFISFCVSLAIIFVWANGSTAWPVEAKKGIYISLVIPI